MSKRKLNIIYENRKELSGLLKGNVKLKDQKTYVNLYQEVLKRILEEQLKAVEELDQHKEELSLTEGILGMLNEHVV